MLILKGVLRLVAQTAVLAALLLGTAGTWDWPRAQQFLVAFAVLGLAGTLVLHRVAPRSLEARVDPSTVKTQPVADRFVALFLGLALVGWLVLIPIDVWRLELFPPPPPAVAFAGALVALAGYAVMFAALLQNAYAAPIVADQAERGQVLVDTGLFAHVRHPLYLGAVAFFAGVGLWLGSWASLLALLVVVAALVARIHVEERTLRDTLPGYPEYLERVRYRLVPGLW